MLQRRLINVLRYTLENLVPPFLRDQSLVMALPMRLVFGRNARFVMDFKRRAPFMTEQEMGSVYEEIRGLPSLFRGETDLNAKCLDRILSDAAGCSSILEVGCGNGFLAEKLAAVVPEVTAADIYLNPEVSRRPSSIKFVRSNAEQLDFPDASFDIVVATHMLEHLQRPRQAAEEMRRVARSGIIIVVPRERPYRYTFNLHIQFFPYEESLLYALNAPHSHVCELLGGDFYYYEAVSPSGGGGGNHVDRGTGRPQLGSRAD